jgi:hypothetical protein
MKYLSKALVVSKAKEEVRNLLGDIIGMEREGREDQPTTQDSEGGSDPSKTSEPDIVDTVFDSIFH